MHDTPKICPILSSGAIVGGKDGQNRAVDCIRGRCQHWTGAYTTEGIMVWDCAVVINATKDSNGRIPV